MDDSDLLDFTPVPVRPRHDGWTAKKQYFYILGLARGFRPAKAAAILGMTHKSAYELCKMDEDSLIRRQVCNVPREFEGPEAISSRVEPPDGPEIATNRSRGDSAQMERP